MNLELKVEEKSNKVSNPKPLVINDYAPEFINTQNTERSEDSINFYGITYLCILR